MSNRPESPPSPRAEPTIEAVRRAVEVAPDGIVAVDAAGIILFANPMACEQFGYQLDDMIGMPVENLLPEDLRQAHRTHRAAYITQPRSRPMGSGLDLRARHRSGEEFPVEISLSPVVAEGTPFVVAIVRDVTERRRAAEELIAAHEELALVDDRERIARDLHDTVIQRLFAVGLSLQGVLLRSPDPAVAERVEQAVEEIDATIRDLRTAIFSLHVRRVSDGGVRDTVLGVTREAARALGFEPQVHFEGLVDTTVTPAILDQLIPTLREALSNVTRHAAASRTWVAVEVADGRLVLQVADNGVGIGDSTRAGHGLGNMENRALALGGSCRVTTRPDGGTVVDWTVPLT